MFCLQSLPLEALDEVFPHLSQSQTLAIAPLHSKLYYAARTKLYRNIYVYEAWPLSDGSRFRFRKDNALKSNYTIVSRHNLEKYLPHMHSQIQVHHIVFKEFHRSFSERIMQHFKAINHFEILLCISNRYEMLHIRWGLSDFVTDASERVSTEFTLPSWPTYTDTSYNPQTALHAPVYSEPYQEILTESFPMLSSLSVVVHELCTNVVGREHPKNFRLRKLHLHHYQPLLDYCISEIYDTSLLQELTIASKFRFETVFKANQLEEEYPHLSQLCIRYFGEKQDGPSIKDLKQFSHRQLRMLVVTSRYSNHSLAQAISGLCLNFPKSSINWWYEPLWLTPLKKTYDTLLTHDINWLSPLLPYGTVGYHFPEIFRSRMTKYNHVVFKEVFSDPELNAIYDGLLDKDSSLDKILTERYKQGLLW